MKSKVSWIALVVALGGCDTLPVLEPGSCGNGVVDDETEDCDGVSASCRPPGSDGACRYSCSSDAPCPGGFRCGTDGICRAPRDARFHPPAQLDAQLARDVRVADLDGDGLAEPISLRGDGLAIARLGPPGAVDGLTVTATSVLRGVRTVPDVDDLTGDGLPDLVLADRGVVVVRGGTAPAPIPSPTFLTSSPLFVADAVVPGELADPTLGAGSELVTAEAGSLVVRLAGQATVVAQFAPSPDGWQGTAVGDLRESADGCDELVVGHGANATETKLSIITLCAPSGQGVVPNAASAIPVVDVALSPPTTLLGVLVADVDRDGHLDVVARGLENLYVAYGDGAGGFTSGPCGTGTPGEAIAIGAQKVSFNVLALDDLNADGRVDVVEQRAEGAVVRLSTQPAAGACDAAPFEDLGAPVATSSANGWQHARVADFDGDGWLDVAAVPATTGLLVNQGLDYFSGGPGGTFAYTRLDVGKAAGQIQVGDFDGNGLSDLAVVGLSGDSGAPQGELFVLFGAAHEPPGSPTSLGDVGEVLTLAAAGVQPSYAATLDKPDELVCVSAGAAEQRISIFQGATSKQLFAPLLTPDPLDAQASTLPMRGAVGRFGAAALPGVAVVSRAASQALSDGRDRVWFAENGGDGTLTVAADARSPVSSGLSDALSLAPPSASVPAFAPLDNGVAVAADTDGDGLDEAYFLGFTAIQAGSAAGGVIAGLRPGAEPALAATGIVFVSVENKDAPITSFAAQALATLRSRALVVDLDGDGDEEIVALGVRVADGAACLSPGILVVLDGDGAGFVDVAGAPVLEPDQSDGEFTETFISFALAEVDGDPTPEIVALSRPAAAACGEGFDAGQPSRLHVIDVTVTDGPASAWTFSRRALEIDQGEVAALLEIQADTLAAGDVNGDGLDDLVGGGPKGTFVVLGLDRLGGGT